MLLSIISALLVAPPLAARAPNSSAAPVPSSNRIWVTGSSNIRHFTCRARAIAADLAWRPDSALGPLDIRETAVTSARIAVPADSLDCGIGRMNRHLRETLHADRFDTLSFELRHYDAVAGDTATTLAITGVMTIAGETREITVSADLVRDPTGALHVTGTFPIRLADYGVAPPRRFAGLLRVRDTVTVHFDLALAAM